MRGPRSEILWDRPQAMLEGIVRYVEKIVIGKRESIEHVLVAILCGGHVLLEDVPGVGKTLMAKTIARTLGCEFGRVQCTPDLLPSDVTGVSIYRKALETFEFRPGPIMANIVLADELNRTPPKTQSALLEAMEERHVTVDGESYRLPEPFVVLATQNPHGFEGAYPLPEAQLDRFLMKIGLGYPTPEEEESLLSRADAAAPEPRALLTIDELRELQRQASATLADSSIKQYVVRLVHATRRASELSLGASPRASMALLRAAQAQALLRGRGFVVPDDVKALAVPVLAHRLAVRPEAAYAGATAEQVLRRILKETPVPAATSSYGGIAR
ncbi:AAA family ATPase [Paenibacillus thermotolerans]|uniref:AAA family ATPase n=1 Tax=Paenibacillus thermotolerans TaxID=3027807 RepID=UPI0023678CE6|nr:MULTISPECIES: MoxR family ATPase [unclassified Paenibacillus]